MNSLTPYFFPHVHKKSIIILSISLPQKVYYLLYKNLRLFSKIYFLDIKELNGGFLLFSFGKHDNKIINENSLDVQKLHEV
jgi:hypothetical protein